MENYGDGLNIRLTNNGFVVIPAEDSPHTGRYISFTQWYVFRTAAELAAWLIKRYPNKKPQKP